MKLSEVIKEIENMQKYYGDLKVHSFKLRDESGTTEMTTLLNDRSGRKLKYRDWCKSIKKEQENENN